MQNMEFKGRWVLVTGASSGLGEEMARQLAAEGANLVLVARRYERLALLRAELERQHGVQCRVISADLSLPDDIERVHAEVAAGVDIYAVILNAGVTHFGRHDQLAWRQVNDLIATNVTGVLHLAHLFLPDLIARKQGGGLLLVSSMAGLLPTPFQAAYSGSKAFVSHFGQALAQEVRGREVSVTVFCPGGIDTAMTRDSKLNYFSDTPFLQSVEDCAADGLNALRTRKKVFVPGTLNRLQLFMTRFAPRAFVNRITHDAYRRALDEA
jgi:short-subunit dehydrogenase